ncbi:MAG: response regulator transcription factor [Cyanobacteriota bacterium]|jgi:two-component system response regulator MprA
MTAARLLIVDDDPELRRFLVGELAAEGHDCLEAATGQAALTQIRAEPPDLVLLDWTLPDFSGVEVCRRMRASAMATPVLMLTARDDVRERVEALDAGADDYLTKPFSIEELLARVRALLRRGQLSGGGDRLEVGDLVLDRASHEVSRGGRPIHLSAREFDLLACLLQEPGRVQPRQRILETVWGCPFVGDPSLLDVYIRYLRRKIEASGRPTLIQTVRGVGFLIKEGEVRAAEADAGDPGPQAGGSSS